MESKNLPNSNFGALEKHFINRHLIFILICKMWPYVTFVFAPNYEVFIEELNTYINSHNTEKFCCRIEEIPLSMVNQYFWSYERVEELVLFKLIVTCKY